MMLESVTRPVLRYHGGKWKLAPWLISLFPVHRIYTESFGGGAAVLLRKPRAYSEVYNDLDGEIVNVFRVLRDRIQAAQLKRLLTLTPYAREEFVLSYEPSDDSLEQARRTIVRSFMGFGSGSASGHATGFRSNSNRSHTTPAHDWMHYADVIDRFVTRLQGVIIENRDAKEVIRQHDGADVLHYLDPPYPLGTRTIKGHYDTIYRHEMTDDDHRDLAGVARTLSGMVVISGYPCDLYDQELYSDWQCIQHGHHADGALDRVEVLWLNPAATGRTQGVLAL